MLNWRHLRPILMGSESPVEGRLLLMESECCPCLWSHCLLGMYRRLKSKSSTG